VSARAATVGPHGRLVKGPSALGSDPRRLVTLMLALAVTDFKLRFFGSVLGYFWQLMRPLLLFGVLYTVFSLFFEVGDEVRFYPITLLLGIVLFNFMAEATTGSVRSLVARENLVRKIEFPRLAVPTSTVLTALFNLGLNLLPVFVFLLAAGGRPRWSWLELPFLVVLLVLFASGLAMLLSALFVRYRDIEPIWDVALQLLFYGSPVLYTLQMVSDRTSPAVAHLLAVNPFTSLMQQMRHAIIDPSNLSAAQALGGQARVLVPLSLIAVLLALGYRVFNREAPRVAEDL
jgi:ABC-2 type transport system permease protein